MSLLGCLGKGRNGGEERGSKFTLLSVPSSERGVKFHLAYLLKFGLSSTHNDTQCIQEAKSNRVPLATTHAYTEEEMGRYPTLYLLNFGYHCCEDNIYPHLPSFKLLHCFQGTVWSHRNTTPAKLNFTYHSQTANKWEKKLHESGHTQTLLVFGHKVLYGIGVDELPRLTLLRVFKIP